MPCGAGNRLLAGFFLLNPFLMQVANSLFKPTFTGSILNVRESLA